MFTFKYTFRGQMDLHSAEAGQMSQERKAQTLVFVGIRQSIPSRIREGWGKARQPVCSFMFAMLFIPFLPFIHTSFPFASSSSSSLLLFLPSTTTRTSPAPSLLLPPAPSHQNHQLPEGQHRSLSLPTPPLTAAGKAELPLAPPRVAVP